MKAFVVDVNVPIVANGRSPQANFDCQSACVDVLLGIVENGLLVIDDQMQIIDEYRRYLSPSGQPGVGDAFMQWVWENQAVIEHCEQVHLTLTRAGFSEFPNDPRLRKFDPSDHIYVALVKASHHAPIVLNAVDPDWWEHREALLQNGVRINFLCPQNMTS